MVTRVMPLPLRKYATQIIAAASISSAALLAPQSAMAQAIETIAAIVNDEVISTYDVQQRVGLVLSSSGIKPTEDVIKRIQSQVVRSLVDEKLQLQEAAKYEVAISDEEISQSIGRLAQQNQMKAQDLEFALRSAGIDIRTLRNQIKAELAWSRVVNGLLGSRVSVTQDEIDLVLNRLITNANKPQFAVSEILLEIPTPDQENEVRQGAQQLIQQMREGIPFSVVAQQFSSAPSAAQGGDIGWVQEDELSPDVAAVITKLSPGQLSNPIRTLSGYKILALRERRVMGGSDPMQSKVDLRQIMIPLANDADSDATESAGEKALAVKSALSGCSNIEEAAKKASGSQSMSMGTIFIKDLAGGMRSAVASLQAGQSSDPVRSDNGLHILIVCSREDTGEVAQLPSRDQIENRLYNQELSMLARRHLRDLRRDSTIEMR